MRWLQILSSVIVVSALAGGAACVSDDKSVAASAGSEGQACYQNGTCDGTLSCVSKLCVQLDGAVSGAEGGAGGDGGAGGGGGEGGSAEGGAGGEGGAVVDGGPLSCSVPDASAVVHCGGKICSASQVCCATDDTCVDYGTCTGAPVQCESSAGCSDGKICCVQLEVLTASTGGTCTTAGNAGALCDPGCSQDEYQLCGLGETCANGNPCTPIQLTLDNTGDTRTLGYCPH